MGLIGIQWIVAGFVCENRCPSEKVGNVVLGFYGSSAVSSVTARRVDILRRATGRGGHIAGSGIFFGYFAIICFFVDDEFPFLLFSF
ncbi:MAG: hypothetical protein R6U98_07335, partial [Pirellulaceae bacterium]